MREDHGLFITVEGGEGSGKSTLIKRLYDAITVEMNLYLVTSMEPGGTVIGKKIRNILLDDPVIRLSAKAELMLFLADRAHHIDTLILPALAEDMIVLVDRFTDSSIVYQGYAREQGDARKVRSMCDFVSEGLDPDLTLYIDVDPKVGLSRIRGNKDRIETEDMAFHERVREGYQKLAQQNPRRIATIDGSQTEDAVFEAALNHVKEAISKKPYPIKLLNR